MAMGLPWGWTRNVAAWQRNEIRVPLALEALPEKGMIIQLNLRPKLAHGDHKGPILIPRVTSDTTSGSKSTIWFTSFSLRDSHLSQLSLF